MEDGLRRYETQALGAPWPDRPAREVEVPPRGEPMPADATRRGTCATSAVTCWRTAPSGGGGTRRVTSTRPVQPGAGTELPLRAGPTPLCPTRLPRQPIKLGPRCTP